MGPDHEDEDDDDITDPFMNENEKKGGIATVTSNLGKTANDFKIEPQKDGGGALSPIQFYGPTSE